MTEKLLKVVEEIEAEAERIILDARQRADVLHSEGEAEARRIVEKAREAALKEASGIADDARGKIEKETREVRKREEARGNETLKRARGRIERAAALLIAKIEGR